MSHSSHEQTEPEPARVEEYKEQPGEEERPMSEDETLDEALDDTFPASDPVGPSIIDGPNN